MNKIVYYKQVVSSGIKKLEKVSRGEAGVSPRHIHTKVPNLCGLCA